MRIKVAGMGLLFHHLVLLGFFSQVSTMADVKEEVLKYIMVMARPMVLLGDFHPVRFTGVYAEVDEDAKDGYKFFTSATIPVNSMKK